MNGIKKIITKTKNTTTKKRDNRIIDKIKKKKNIYIYIYIYSYLFTMEIIFIAFYLHT